MAKVRIEDDGYRASIYIDNQKLDNVRGYSISHYAQECAVVSIEMLAPTVEVSGDGVITEVMTDAEDQPESV